MSLGDRGGPFIYDLPPAVLWDFCRVMDGLSDRDWTGFASEVLGDQTSVRLAEREERRTDWVMNHWGNRKGRVGELINLLGRLQLLRPLDILMEWVSIQSPSSPPPLAAVACAAGPPLSQFDPPPKKIDAPPTPITLEMCNPVSGRGVGKPLPRPAPPPSILQSDLHVPPQAPPAEVAGSGGVMCWSYDEVHAGTQGFSPSLQVGEGGFGVVYRATLRNTDCAVKKLKEDGLLDLSLLKESFQTEVEKLSKFRHPNIVDLLGFSEEGGSVCLIYSYMENKSLEDQLHNACVFLSWSQRVAIVNGASTALQYLHCPPGGYSPLIHGDVKSSNILLDQHMVPKLADFGLARNAVRGSSSGRSASQTTSIGKTETIRGTLAYLPDEYVRNGQLGTAVDVYSFGVVLLEVLTRRRALERDRNSGARYLKDLVDEVEVSPSGSSAESWRKHLDPQLILGGAAEPAGWMETAALACRCLDRNRKRRPAMMKIFDKLQDIEKIAGRRSSSSTSSPNNTSQSSPGLGPSQPLNSSVGALSMQLSRLGPLEDTYQSSSSSSSPCSLTSPHPLHSSSLSSSPSSSLLLFAGPCETDESRGFSQYDLRSQVRSNGTSYRSLSQGERDHGPTGLPNSHTSLPSFPTEDQYSFHSRSSNSSTGDAREGATAGGGVSVEGGVSDIPESLFPAGSLHSSCTGSSVHMNSSKQRFLQKKSLYEEGRIQTPELLSSEDLYGRRESCEEVRGPEKSEEHD